MVGKLPRSAPPKIGMPEARLHEFTVLTALALLNIFSKLGEQEPHVTHNSLATKAKTGRKDTAMQAYMRARIPKESDEDWKLVQGAQMVVG